MILALPPAQAPDQNCNLPGPPYYPPPSLKPAGALDICTRCAGIIPANAQWFHDRAYCVICALAMITEGHQMHGSRIQDRFWVAAGKARPGLRAEQLLWEECPVTLSGRNFKADFIVRLTPHIKIAVELDSFTHHSSAQALARDHQRQRLFQKDGWLIVRFAGSEVWRDPAGCVEELIEIVCLELRRRGYLPLDALSAAA